MIVPCCHGRSELGDEAARRAAGAGAVSLQDA